MKAATLALTILLAATPIRADEAPPGDAEAGSSLIEEGVKLLFRGLMSEIEPAMKDLAEEMDRFATEAEPMLRELIRLMEDISNYHPPEILPNGDIIIRRRLPGELGPEGEIEI